MKEIKIYNTLVMNVYTDNGDEYQLSPMDYADEIAEKVEAYDDGDLADYADSYHGSTYYTKLQKITLGTEIFNGCIYGLATCTVSDDWNDSDTAQLKEYLTGQYADGWGEGFEQREIHEFSETEPCEEYDEENDEYYESDYEVRHSVYCNFWQDHGYRIMTETELKA